MGVLGEASHRASHHLCEEAGANEMKTPASSPFKGEDFYYLILTTLQPVCNGLAVTITTCRCHILIAKEILCRVTDILLGTRYLLIESYK
jgi:hypothetical protein